jgi:signal transduction histidine kinase
MSIQKLSATTQARWQNGLHSTLRRLRWAIFPAVLILASLHRLTIGLIADPLPSGWQGFAEVGIYSLTGSLVTWVGLTWIANAVSRRALVEDQLQAAYQELEQRHHQLLSLNKVGQAVAAADNQQDIVELATRAPLELTAAQASTVVTFDNHQDRLNLDMAWGLSESYLTELRRRIDQGIPAERCRTCNILHASAEGDCPLFDGLQPLAELEGLSSLVCLPITLEKERTSVITAYFPAASGPSEDHIRLLGILGSVISGTLENLRIRTRQSQTIESLDRAINTPSPQVLENIADQVLDIALAGWETDAGGLFIYDSISQAWSCQAQRGLGDDLADIRFKLGIKMSQQAFEDVQPIIESELKPSADHALRSAASAPLITEGTIIGALFIGSKRPNAINHRHIELLAAIAHQIALAIRNVQLYTQLEQMAVLEERQRLGREFHDGLAQTLGYLNLQAQQIESLIASDQTAAAAAEMGAMRKHIRAAYVDVREAIDGLRLSLKDPDQLAARLKEYTLDFSRQFGIETEFSASPHNLSTNAEIALQVLRITQESLTNIRKHAQASRARVQLKIQDGQLELDISDNGIGFPPSDSIARSHRSHGLTMMRERAESLGGAFSVATRPGKGTNITVNIPLEHTL